MKANCCRSGLLVTRDLTCAHRSRSAFPILFCGFYTYAEHSTAPLHADDGYISPLSLKRSATSHTPWFPFQSGFSMQLCCTNGNLLFSYIILVIAWYRTGLPTCIRSLIIPSHATLVAAPAPMAQTAHLIAYASPSSLALSSR